MGTGLGWDSNRLIVQGTGNPFTETYCVVWPNLYENEMGISGCTEKCPRQFTFLLVRLEKCTILKLPQVNLLHTQVKDVIQTLAWMEEFVCPIQMVHLIDVIVQLDGQEQHVL